MNTGDQSISPSLSLPPSLSSFPLSLSDFSLFSSIFLSRDGLSPLSGKQHGHQQLPKLIYPCFTVRKGCCLFFLVPMFPVGGKDLISLPSIWCLYSRSQSSQEGRTPPLECYGWNKGKSFTEEGKSVRLMNLGMHVRDILGAWECFPKLKLVLVLPSFAFS